MTTPFYSPTGIASPRGMKLCPIHRTCRRGDFLSDGWEPVELHDDVLFVELAFLFLSILEFDEPENAAAQKRGKRI
jgi:hypothetical protein